MAEKSKQYVLVHGAWQGAWCWEVLAAILRSKGHRVHSVDLPGHGLNQYPLAEVTYQLYYDWLKREINRFDEPVILVAHSMSGMIAAPLLDELPKKIDHLFLIAAYMPQKGQSLLDIALSGGPSDLPSLIINNPDGFTQSLDLSQAGKMLYFDCPEKVVEWAVPQLQPQPIAPITAKVMWQDSGRAKEKRSYILCEEDRDVHPITQQVNIDHYPCRVIRMKSGHFPFLSHPDELAEILEH